MVGTTAKFSPNESFKEKWHFKLKDYNTAHCFHFTSACKIVWKVQLCITAASSVLNYAVFIYLSEAVVVLPWWFGETKKNSAQFIVPIIVEFEQKSFKRRTQPLFLFQSASYHSWFFRAQRNINSILFLLFSVHPGFRHYYLSFSIHRVTCGPTGTAKDPDQALGWLGRIMAKPPSSCSTGPRQTDDSSRWDFFFFLRSVELHWFDGSRRMSHMRWTVLNDFAIPFPFKLPLLSLSDTCLNQCLPLQVMGWMYWGAHRPPLKSTKINTIIEIFSSWLHWGPRLGWLLWVCSSVARGSKSSCIIWFLLLIWKR